MLCRQLISYNLYCSWCVCQPEPHYSVLKLHVPGVKCGVELVAFLDSDEVIRIENFQLDFSIFPSS